MFARRVVFAEPSRSRSATRTDETIVLFGRTEARVSSTGSASLLFCGVANARIKVLIHWVASVAAG